MIIPSHSKKQQRLFGMVRQCQKTGNCASKKIKDMSNKIDSKDVEDFAKTKHKDLPEKVSRFKSYKEFQEAQMLPWAAQRAISMASNVNVDNMNRQQKINMFTNMINSIKPDFYDITQFIRKLRQIQANMNPSQETEETV